MAQGAASPMSASSLGRRLLRLVAVNDIYDLKNLPKLQTFLSSLSPPANAVVLAGDFVSPSTLSSIDEGRGMVATLRAAGVTHACFGNHEADLKMSVLRQRIEEFSKSATVINSNMRHPATPSASWLASELTPSHAIVSSSCGQVRLALLGLMSDEEGMFRDGTFKGVPISDVKSTFTSMHRALLPDAADFIVPLTHQSIKRDRDLAEHMLDDLNYENGVILGGHDHYPIDETVRSCDSSVRIVKSGHDAQQASLIDLSFDVTVHPPSLIEASATLMDLTKLPDSPIVKKIADTHLSVIQKMEREIVVDDTVVPLDISLSSKRTRYSQTTVGAFFCQAIKEEMEADVAIMNGASIKGGTIYDDNRMSFAQLKMELPFPTKMVVVPMTRGDLLDAIEYSRTQVEERESTESTSEIPRRGYLQVDFDYDRSDWYTEDSHEVIHVALPRNLLNGFCHVRPLMDVGTRLKKARQFPSEDDFVPAIDLVTRYCCKTKWMEITGDSSSEFIFSNYDLDKNGVLDKDEIKAMMKAELGYEPEDTEVEHMINAIDADGDGTIDAGELSYLLATMERRRS